MVDTGLKAVDIAYVGEVAELNVAAADRGGAGGRAAAHAGGDQHGLRARGGQGARHHRHREPPGALAGLRQPDAHHRHHRHGPARLRRHGGRRRAAHRRGQGHGAGRRRSRRPCSTSTTSTSRASSARWAALLGEAGVNIATFNLGRTASGGDAIALVGVDQMPDEALLGRVRALPHVKEARALRVLAPYLGARIMIIWRPSMRGSYSTLASSSKSTAHFLQQLHAQFRVTHLAAAEAQGDLHLVALFEEAVHGLGLHFVVVNVDVRAELDLLDLDQLLALARFVLLLLFLELELAEIQDLADGRICRGETSTRSSPASLAASRAAEVGMIPCFSPCWSISRTRGTRISSLIRGPSFDGGAGMGRRIGMDLFVVQTGVTRGQEKRRPTLKSI